MKIFIYLYKMNKINKMKKRLIFLALVLFLLIAPNIVSSAPTITANATSPTNVYTNTDFKFNMTATDQDNLTFTSYVQFYVNDTPSGSVVIHSIENDTNTNVANLSSSGFGKGANLTAEFWAGDGTANTTKGNTTQVTVQNFVPTQPSLTHPDNNAYINSITMNWTASTDTDNDIISYYVLVNETQVCYTTDLNCSYSPAEGYYQWNVTPYDGEENGTASSSKFYTYDITNPLLTITSTNNTLTNILPTINGTTSDANNDSIYANNSAWSWNNNYTNWGFTNNTNIADGNYHILITANDSAGNTNSSLFNFTYDSTPPTPSNTGRNDSFIEVNDTVSFYANWSDSVGLSHYIFSWNNSGTMGNDSALLLTSWSNIIREVNATNRSIINWIIYANDTVGNWNNTGIQIFRISNSAPTKPNLTNPVNNSYTNTTITMNWTESTDADSDTVSYYVLVNGTKICDTTDLNCSYNPSEGYYEWHVTPYDETENGTTSSSRFYTYDITKPIITNITYGSVTSSGATLTMATNENANCAYTNTNSSVEYASMTAFSTTGGTSHSKSLTGLSASTNYIYYVRCNDTAGNIMNFSNSTTFETLAASTSSGGGGGGTPTVTYEEKSIGTLAAGSTKAIAFTKSSTLAVTEITVTVKNKVTNAKIKVDTGSLPSGASKPSTKGTVYKYIDITKTGMTDDDIEKAVINFKVKKSWLTDKGYGIDAVSLHRYNNKKWEKLETSRVGFGAEYYYYSSESSGFSTFAITAEKAPAVKPAEKTTEEATKKEPEKNVTETLPEEELTTPKLRFNFSSIFNNMHLEFNHSWLLITIIVMAVLAVYFVQRKWNVLKISVGMESEAIIAVTSKMEKAEKLIQEGDINSAKKTYKKVLKIYDGLPVKERKWVYKEIQSLYNKLKTAGE